MSKTGLSAIIPILRLVGYTLGAAAVLALYLLIPLMLLLSQVVPDSNVRLAVSAGLLTLFELPVLLVLIRTSWRSQQRASAPRITSYLLGKYINGIGSLPQAVQTVRAPRQLARTGAVARELVQVGFFVLLIWLTTQQLVTTFRVDGSSMVPTFQPGQLLLINKVAYVHVDGTPWQGRVPSRAQGSVEYLFGGPQRGDLVVFRSPIQRNKNYIKRIIGLPGEEIQIADGQVWVNGQRLNEPYVHFPLAASETFPEDDRPLRVPDGSYFVLGDNRPASSDSRGGWVVPVENVVGQAWLAVWPPATWGLVPQPLPQPASEEGALPAEVESEVASRPSPVPPSPTPATLTPSGVPDPASLRPVLEERFGDSPGNWPNNPQATAWLTEGAYRLFARQPGQFVAIGAPLTESLRDVVVTASFRKVGGPPGGGYGVIVRDQGPGPRDGLNQGGRYYVLAVGDRGEVGIWRREGDHWVDLVPWTRFEAVHPGQLTNQVRVEALGSRLTLVVNGTPVASVEDVEDAVFGPGGVGLFVGGDLNEVVLDQFIVQVPTAEAAGPSPAPDQLGASPTAANQAVVRRFYEEMLSQHNLEVAAELFTEDFVNHAAESPAGRLSGIAGVKQEVGGYLQAFPDMRVTIEDSIAEGDRVAIRGVLTGTQRGELAGIPATGKPVTVPVQQVFRLKDGKIAEAWLEIDRPGILQQLGAIPAPTATAPSSTPSPAPAAQPEDYEDYIVREGDTLRGIAERFGTSVEALRQANPLTDPDQVEIGRRLVIPR